MINYTRVLIIQETKFTIVRDWYRGSINFSALCSPNELNLVLQEVNVLGLRRELLKQLADEISSIFVMASKELTNEGMDIFKVISFDRIIDEDNQLITKIDINDERFKDENISKLSISIKNIQRH